MSVDLMLKVLSILSFVIAASISVKLIAEQSLTRYRIFLIAILGAIPLTAYSWFFLMGHSYFFQEEGLLSSKIASLKQYIGDEDAAYKYVDSTFIFLDTKDNVTLVPNGTAKSKTSMVITDRKMLSEVLQFLFENQSQYDLLACDLIFDKRSIDDQLLNDRLQLFRNSKKLLLAYRPGLTHLNPTLYQSFDSGQLGDVAMVTDEPLYYSNDIQTLGDEPLYSFPYLMYLKTNKKSAADDKKGSYVFSNSITSLSLGDETKLYPHSISGTREQPKDYPGDRYSSETSNYFILGALNTEAGRDRFLDKIRSKPKGSKTIIMIGNFYDQHPDRHQTPIGILAGATLIINEYYQFHQGAHKISYLELLGMFLYLFLGFVFIIGVILWRAGKRDLRSIQGPVENRLSRFWIYRALSNWLLPIVNIALDEAHYIALFCLVIVLNLLFDKVMNVMGLIYVLPLFSVLLKYQIAENNRRLNSL